MLHLKLLPSRFLSTFSASSTKNKNKKLYRKLYINDLDTDALLYVFDRLPLRALLNLNRVCKRWYALHPIVCARRRSLTLLIGNKKWYKSLETDTPELDEMVNDDGVRTAGWWSAYNLVPKLKYPEYMPELSLSTTLGLIRLFPNVTSLKISHAGISSDNLENVIYLLDELAPKLISLRLMCQYTKSPMNLRYKRSKLFDSLLDTINSMTRLEDLHLDIFHRLAPNWNKLSIDLRIIGQLRHFSFISSDHVDLVMDQLRRYGRSNPRLETVAIRNALIDDGSLSDAMGLHPLMASKFTELRIASPIDLFILERFVRRFPNLRVLYINVELMDMASLISTIRPLNQLKCLHLVFEYPHPLTEYSPPLLEMPSIVGLSIHVNSVTHLAFEYLHLDRVFPNLQVVGLRNVSMRCIACRIFLPEAGYWASHRCNKNLLKQVKRCKNLKRIYSDQKVTHFWKVAHHRLTVIDREVFPV